MAVPGPSVDLEDSDAAFSFDLNAPSQSDRRLPWLNAKLMVRLARLWRLRQRKGGWIWRSVVHTSSARRRPTIPTGMLWKCRILSVTSAAAMVAVQGQPINRQKVDLASPLAGSCSRKTFSCYPAAQVALASKHEQKVNALSSTVPVYGQRWLPWVARHRQARFLPPELRHAGHSELER